MALRRSVALLALLAAGAAAQGQNLSARERARIDGNTADLISVGGIYVTPSGGAIVTQLRDQRLVVFDSSLKIIRRLGGRGSGPGEFQSITSAGWSGDTLWVFDRSLSRITLFSPEGKLYRTEPLRLSTMDVVDARGKSLAVREVRVYGRLTNGDMLVSGSLYDAPERSLGLPRHPIFRMDAKTQATRFISWIPFDSSLMELSTSRGPRGIQVPFFPIARWDVSSNNRVVAMATTARHGPTRGSVTLTAWRSNGEALFAVKPPVPLIPLPRTTIDSVLKADPARMKDPDYRGALPSIAARIPDFYPPITGLLAGKDGSIWLRGSVDGDPSRPWVAVDPAGRVFGKVLLPRTSQIMEADLTRLWVVEYDEDTIPSIVIYDVVKR